MCAIAGIIGGEQAKKKPNEVKSMLLMMKHRGPDFTNYMEFDGALFGHNRLSIIDTHQRANQPMKSNDNNLLLVFNGEIYNYLELRDKLKTYYNFKTKSDSEVLLAAFQKWGVNSFKKLNGAFAFCIYDKKSKKSYFVRDRFGQKPIFFLRKNNKIYFASEIKAFLSLDYNPKANLKVWYDYLINSQTDNSRDTFFKNIFQLLPGEYAILKNKKINFRRWYDLKSNLKKKVFSSNTLQILKKLSNSAKICSRADVDQAISLSGGLDSNVLLGLYAKNKFLKKIPKTFSVEFGKDFSEKKLFILSHKKFKNKFKTLNFSKDDMLKSLSPTIWHLESPSGGLMNLALAKVCSYIKSEGIKIIQDGTGLDEIFGGYEIHHLAFLAELKRKSKKEFEKSLNLFSKNWGYSKFESLKKVENYNSPFAKTIDGYEVNKDNVFTKFFLKQSKQKSKKNLTYKESMIDFTSKSKIPRNNRLKDRVSMAFGVELRLPFLDHELVESALSLKGKQYFYNGESKSVLRKAVKNLIPEKIRTHKKISIQSPQNIWLKSKKVQSFINEIIYSESFKKRNVFNHKKVKKLWQNFKENKTNTSFFIWQIINLELWFRIFIDSNHFKNEKRFKLNFKN